MIWDVAVIGSGPAGSAVAINCQKAGLRTAVFDFGRRRGSAEVPETIPAAVKPLLESLGIAEGGSRFGLRKQYAMSSAWGSHSLTTRYSICNPAGPGWFVDRPTFDIEMASEAARNGVVQISPARLRSASRDGHHWALRFHLPDNYEPLVVKSAVIVDATGRASAFARRIGLRRVGFDQLLSVSAPANLR